MSEEEKTGKRTLLHRNSKNTYEYEKVWFGLIPRATRPGWEWAWMSQTCLLVSLKSATKFNNRKFIVTICTYLNLAPFNPIRSWLNCSTILIRDQRYPPDPNYTESQRANAGLKQLTTDKKANAGLTFPSIPAFRHYLKGRCHKIFAFRFFHAPVSPKPLSIQLGLFRIWLKIRRDIRSSRCTTGVFDTGGMWKKSSIRKV